MVLTTLQWVNLEMNWQGTDEMCSRSVMKQVFIAIPTQGEKGRYTQ